MIRKSSAARRIVRFTGLAGIVLGLGVGLASLLAPLVELHHEATDSPMPQIIIAFSVTACGAVLVRWSRQA